MHRSDPMSFTRLSRGVLAGALLLSASLAASSAAAQEAILEGERFHPVESAKGMVSTSHTLASKVSRDVLANGGNAVDAAVTAGFALAVT